MRSLRPTVVALLLVATTLAGCGYRYRYETGLPPSGERRHVWLHQGFWGLTPANIVDLEAMCPSGVSAFGSHVNVLNWLPTLATAGLYTPRTAFAECAVGEGDS